MKYLKLIVIYLYFIYLIINQNYCQKNISSNNSYIQNEYSNNYSLLGETGSYYEKKSELNRFLLDILPYDKNFALFYYRHFNDVVRQKGTLFENVVFFSFLHENYVFRNN